MQRRMQASKALELCESKNEFEGSYERVEFERLLLEAHHKYAAANSEMGRLKTEGARRMSASGRKQVLKKSSTKGAISISGISLPLKADFIRMISAMPEQDTIHYFLCLVKYRSQVIATRTHNCKADWHAYALTCMSAIVMFGTHMCACV